jgi:hypothetical protein
MRYGYGTQRGKASDVYSGIRPPSAGEELKTRMNIIGYQRGIDAWTRIGNSNYVDHRRRENMPLFEIDELAGSNILFRQYTRSPAKERIKRIPFVEKVPASEGVFV